MTGNSLFDKILLGLNGLVALAAAGIVYYAHFMIKPEPTNVTTEEQALYDKAQAESMVSAYTVSAKPVNLYHVGARLRYLSTELSIVPFKESDKEILKSHEYVIKNALIEVAAHMTPDEVSTLTGKLLLESRIKKYVNESLGTPIIKKIYFGKFTVQ